VARTLLASIGALAIAASAAGGAAPTPPSDPCSAADHVEALRAQLRLIADLGGTLTPEGRAIADGGPLPGAAGTPGEARIGQVMLATNVPPGAISRRPDVC
jgi:hypothetical protein